MKFFKKNLILIISLIIVFTFLNYARAQDDIIVIKAGKILTITKGIVENGIIIIQKGKIKAVGNNLIIPKSCKVIDFKEHIIMPGIIDAGTTIGIDNSDLVETFDPVTPQLKIIDSFNPFGSTGQPASDFKDAIKGGVTSAFLYPGNNINVIAPQGAIVKLWGKSFKDMVIKDQAAVIVNLGDIPRDFYKKIRRMPTTRMGIMAILRENFKRAQNYIKEEQSFRDPKMEPLIKALKREIPVRIHANRLDDIMAAIRFAEEFNLKLILDHCVEGYKIADFIAKKNIPVIVYNNFLAPKIYPETRGFTEEYAGILSSKGVKVVFQSDSIVGKKILKFARINAIIYVSYGMSKDEALKGLTIYPAQIFGVSDRLGSIEVGKDADLVVLDGDPLNIYTKIKAVLINGQIVYNENKQQK